MRNTKDWTTATISSNLPNKVPNSQVFIGSFLIKESKMCPALMLANSRKQRVIGRTSSLTNSTSLRNAIKYQGELDGTKNEIKLVFVKNNKILKIQKLKAILKLKAKVVVTG